MIENLYVEFFEKLVRYCAAMAGGDGPAAEDLAQETFLRALTHADVVDGLSRRQCWAWLTRTARNLVIDRARKLSRESVLPWEDLDRNAVEEDWTGPQVAQLIALLPEEEETLFIMRYFEGYNAAQLGEMFSLSPSTVRSRLASARRRIQKQLQSDSAR